MAAPTLEANAAGDTLRVTYGTSGDPVRLNYIWDWDDGGGSSGGDGDVPKDGGGTVKVSTFMTEIVANRMYQIHKHIQFGDGSTSSFFESLNELVYFDDGYDFWTSGPAVCQLGKLVGSGDEEFAEKGSTWRVAPTASTFWAPLPYGDSEPTLNLFGSNLLIEGTVHAYMQGGTFAAVNAQLFLQMASGKEFFFDTGIESLHLNKVFFVGDTRINFNKAADVFNEVHCHGLRVRSGASVTTTDMTITNSAGLYGANSDGKEFTLINPVFNSAITVAIYHATASIVIAALTDIRVGDAQGDALESATVAATSFGNVVSNDAGSTFYRCIEDHTSGTFATDVAAGKWEETTAASAALAGCTGAAARGAWVTGIAYKKASEEFSVSTDENGEIAGQTLKYWKLLGLSEALLTFSPYTIVISKAGYQSLSLEKIVADSTLDWVQELQDAAGGGASTGPIEQQWVR